MSFDQFSLDQRVLSGIKSVGYTTPTPIQQQAIPIALEGRDLLGLAQTGTGKSAAFILPILQRLSSRAASRKVRALIVVPTRELAEQIHQATISLGRNTRIRSVAIYGGVSKGPQLTELRRGARGCHCLPRPPARPYERERYRPVWGRCVGVGRGRHYV